MEWWVMLSLLGVIGFVLLGIRRHPGWYLAGAAACYVFSYLAGFTIGAYTLVGVFALGALGGGHLLHWVRETKHSLVALSVGVLLWIVAITTLDDRFLFLPFKLL